MRKKLRVAILIATALSSVVGQVLMDGEIGVRQVEAANKPLEKHYPVINGYKILSTQEEFPKLYTLDLDALYASAKEVENSNDKTEASIGTFYPENQANDPRLNDFKRLFSLDGKVYLKNVPRINKRYYINDYGHFATEVSDELVLKKGEKIALAVLGGKKSVAYNLPEGLKVATIESPRGYPEAQIVIGTPIKEGEYETIFFTWYNGGSTLYEFKRIKVE